MIKTRLAMLVRKTRPDDWLAIELLIETARFASPTIWRWRESLTAEGFVVVEVERRIKAALLASSDQSPVAWVRLAALSEGVDVGCWLDVSLPPILAHLRAQDVQALAWMDYENWVTPTLEKWGFERLAKVITLAKTDRALPPVEMPQVSLRTASDADYGILSIIDRKAFTPPWWRSATSMRRRARTTSRFLVAACGHKVIGYAERELDPPKAHINRIAVDPAFQGQGIGAALLKYTLISIWQRGIETVSLNTQRSNRRSQRLYNRFGFATTGDSATVWTLRLQPSKTDRGSIQ